MKQVDIIANYHNLELLKDKNFTAKDQWLIYKLRKTLFSHVEFQREQEAKLRDKYLPFADENGVISGDAYSQYMKEKEDIDNMEVEDIEKITLPVIEGIDFITMEKLENIIEFQLNE